MRRYHIKIYLSDHNVFDAKTEAESLEDAVDNIVMTEEAKDAIGDNEIESVQLVDSEEIGPVKEERFLVQESSDPGYWVITDRQNNLVCKFLERQYSKDYKVTDLDGTPVTDFYTLATAINDMGDYLMARHPELIC